MTPLDTIRTVRQGATILAAYSADGQWAYERAEDTGTTWTIKHLPTGRLLLAIAPTLPSARKFTASGGALAELDRRDAEGRTVTDTRTAR